MGLVKITFDGSSVSAKQDADINYHVTGLIAAGIISGLGNEISYSTSNNYITFQSGYVQIYGRRIFVEAGSQVYVSLDSTKLGYAIIDVDLTSNTVSLTKVEGTSLPTLIQQNLATGGTRYQMPIAKYSKTATSLTVDTTFSRTMIETPLSVANTGYSRAISYIADNYGCYSKYTGYLSDQHKFTVDMGVDQSEVKNSLIVVKLTNNVTIVFPGWGLNNISSFSTAYIVGATTYTLFAEVSSSGLYICTGDTSHKVRQIYCYR